METRVYFKLSRNEHADSEWLIPLCGSFWVQKYIYDHYTHVPSRYALSPVGFESNLRKNTERKMLKYIRKLMI